MTRFLRTKPFAFALALLVLLLIANGAKIARVSGQLDGFAKSGCATMLATSSATSRISANA